MSILTDLYDQDIERLTDERDEAVARAEQAERDLRMFQSGLTDVLRAYNVPAMPSWPEALHWLAKHGSDASRETDAPKET